jgi:hypothetical protein
MNASPRFTASSTDVVPISTPRRSATISLERSFERPSIRAVRLRQAVLDAEHLERSANRGAGDDAGARRRRNDADHRRLESTGDLVRDRSAEHREALHATLGVLLSLLDRGRDLVGLAVANAHPSLPVSDHDQRAEAEPAAALDGGGGPEDSDRRGFQCSVEHFCHDLRP